MLWNTLFDTHSLKRTWMTGSHKLRSRSSSLTQGATGGVSRVSRTTVFSIFTATNPKRKHVPRTQVVALHDSVQKGGVEWHLNKWLETNSFKWMVWNKWFEKHGLKRMVSNEWVQTNGFKRMVWHEWLETNALKWMLWNECFQTNAFKRMVSNEWFQTHGLKRMLWNAWFEAHGLKLMLWNSCFETNGLTRIVWNEPGWPAPTSWGPGLAL